MTTTFEALLSGIYASINQSINQSIIYIASPARNEPRPLTMEMYTKRSKEIK